MNRVLVAQAAGGLADYLKDYDKQPSIVIGYDGRKNSDVFARDTAEIMAGAGVKAYLLPRKLPTPVLAYAIQYFDTTAGVMVTASHNPPEDNGYKVYLGKANGGGQIVSPADKDIAALIDKVAAGNVKDLPRSQDYVGAQPLRRKDLRAGPLFRQLVAQFCESPLAERCGITLEQEEPAEQTVLSVDEALMARLLENLLNNSVRHNSKPVNITVHTRRAGERFCLTVADDGIGYPATVLAALNAADPAENAPHILGLYVVQQIAAAHGGTAVFGQNTPHGAKAVVYLPLG